VPDPELSVIVLCYRAEEHAAEVVLPLLDRLEEADADFELILVANYWSPDDRTRPVAEELARGRERVRVVATHKQGDMGWDMRSGLREARGSYLVIIDGDAQVPVEYALQSWNELKQTGAAVVKGRRYARDDGLIRSLISVGYNVLFRLLFGTRGLWDINGRPKGLTREAFEQLGLVTDDWFTDAEIVLKARRLGLRVHEFPVRFLRNPVRGSFVGLGTVSEFLRNMILWRLHRHHAQRMPPRPPSEVTPPAREESLV
jgi:glycosyltransferase involved in cell wall biosynthesis